MEPGNDAFEKLPLGPVQIELVALPPIIPPRVTVPDEQTDSGLPAVAVAGGSMVAVTPISVLQHPYDDTDPK